MLYTIAVVLLIAWLLGFVGIYTVVRISFMCCWSSPSCSSLVGSLERSSHARIAIQLRAPTAIPTGTVSNLADE